MIHFQIELFPFYFTNNHDDDCTFPFIIKFIMYFKLPKCGNYK